MELLGIQQVLTCTYYPQGNGIIIQSHRTVGNMVRAQLGHHNDCDWVNVLLDIMLMYNEMEQENHGYTASQIIWGKNMNLHTDLLHTPGNVRKSNPSGYGKDLGKKLREVRKRVASFNRAVKRPMVNPFKEDLILIYQQQMRRLINFHLVGEDLS